MWWMDFLPVSYWYSKFGDEQLHFRVHWSTRHSKWGCTCGLLKQIADCCHAITSLQQLNRWTSGTEKSLSEQPGNGMRSPCLYNTYYCSAGCRRVRVLLIYLERSQHSLVLENLTCQDGNWIVWWVTFGHEIIEQIKIWLGRGREGVWFHRRFWYALIVLFSFRTYLPNLNYSIKGKLASASLFLLDIPTIFPLAHLTN